MKQEIITFSANEQVLIKTGGVDNYAADTVSYVKAIFDLGDNWGDFDNISVIWERGATVRCSVLDDANSCIVPPEVVTRKGRVYVNLVGVNVSEEEILERLTTYKAQALTITADVNLCGRKSEQVSPSQFEQFVAKVKDEVAVVTGMTAEAYILPEGSEPEVEYRNGKLIIGIPQGIQGEKGDTGETGNGIASVDYNADYTLTLVFDNGERFTTPPIRGERGPAGADGRDGADGVTPNLSVGNVETLEPTQDAYVTRKGTDDNPIFDFGIPRGQNGTVPDLDLILPTDTASGDIASITDGQSVVPVKSLKVTLEPIQSGSGTPSPDNVRPISGHTEVVTEVCGKNLLDVDDFISGVNCGSDYFAGGRNAVMFDKQGTYTIKANTPSAGYLYARIKNADGTFGAFQPIIQSTTYTTRTLTVTDGQTLLLFDAISNTLATTKSNVSDWSVQVEAGSSATAYEPYQGSSYTNTLGRTVYGGTLDVVSGELVVDRAIAIFDGTENYSNQYFPTVVCGKEFEQGTGRGDSFICNYCPSGIAYLDLANNTKRTFQFSNASTNWGVNSADELKAKIAQWYANGEPLTICYPLATPQTYQLDPQQVMLLHGNNNVWSDGEIEMVYNADVGLYIAKVIS